jgi:hypothetical protein
MAPVGNTRTIDHPPPHEAVSITLWYRFAPIAFRLAREAVFAKQAATVESGPIGVGSRASRIYMVELLQLKPSCPVR